MIFTQNHSALQRTTGARFCRTDLLRTFRKDFIHTFKFLNPKAHRIICTHQAHHMYQQKIQYQLFFLTSVYSQTTKEILHKNVSYHSDIIFFENSRKIWVSEKKSTFESDAHSAVWWRSQFLQLGTGFRKKKASFKESAQ